MKSRLIKELIEKSGCTKIEQNVDMSKEVSFRAGGKADIMIAPQNVGELQSILRLLEEKNVPHIVIGNGSNILIKDGGYRGVVVKISSENFGDIKILSDKLSIKAGAGVLMSTLGRFLLEKSLTGFEFGSGIPGSLGGAVFMNAGAYGGEIKDILIEATVLTRDGKELKTLTCEDLQLKYRDSILHKTGDIVIDVTLKLQNSDKQLIEEKMIELNQRRNEKQPVNYPSAGSFFKRPEGYFAGKLVQDANLKGYSVGGAQISEKHGGFVINKGGATATDIVNLMKHCQKEVFEKFGVKLEPEVQILGEDI